MVRTLAIVLLLVLTNLVFGEMMDGAEYVRLDNGYKVYTRRVGAGPIQILLLHGGPGCTHEYFECFKSRFPEDQFQIIFYDQLGSYFSDQPNDPELWTLDRFVEEVEQIRAALHLDNFFLLGHSWGGLLAMEYSLKYQHHLKGLIISNMTASVPDYIEHFNHLRRQLSQESQDILAKYEERGEFTHPDYEKVLYEELYAKHLCRLSPWPDPVVRTFAHLSQPVYMAMQGPNEFVFTGNLKDWDRWADLSQIQVPTLLIGSRYDTMNPEQIKKMGTLIPQAEVVICENGSHMAMYDDPDAYFKALHNFLK